MSSTMTEQVLRDYSEGRITARQAATQLGPWASEHDVFVLTRRQGLPLPQPPGAEVEAQVEAGLVLYRRLAAGTVQDPAAE
jgi:hypothetical protein